MKKLQGYAHPIQTTNVIKVMETQSPNSSAHVMIYVIKSVC